MNKLRMLIPALMIFAALACSSGENGTMGAGPGELKAADIQSQGQKLSYAIGYSVGQKIKGDKVEGFDLRMLIGGMNDAMNSKDPALTDEEIREAFMAHQKALAEKTAAEADVNLKKADEFMARNETAEGVKTLEKGLLQYRVIQQGQGKKSPSMDDKVELHYRGTTLDGNEFDSSYKRGKPAVMSGNSLIPGFGTALTRMKEGDKWEIYIHPNLAYGQRSPSPDIPANALLIFEIEVLSIK